MPDEKIKATRPLSTSMHASKQHSLGHRKKMAHMIKVGPSENNFFTRPKTCKKLKGAYGIQSLYQQDLDPSMVQFVSSNILTGAKIPVHVKKNEVQ